MIGTASEATLRTAPVAAHRAWLWAGGMTLVSWLLLGWVYWDTAASIVAIWMRSATYAHGFLVLPISAFLIWRQRRTLASLSPRPQWLGVAALGVLSLGWLVGQVADILLATQLALVAMIPAAAWALLGTAVVRAVAFPLGFLVFAVPWGEAWTPMLQDITAAVSVQALDLTGIPVFREGHYISIPAGDFQVAETCSGLRYLIASLALGALYAYLTYKSIWRRLAFFAAAAVVPVLANGLRAYGVMLLGHLTDMRWGTGEEHVVLGRVFFISVMIFLFWAGSYWRETDSKRPGDLSGPARAATFRLRSFLPALMAVGAVGAAGPVLAEYAAPGGAPAPTRVVLPDAAEGWQGPAPAGSAWAPRFPGADVTRQANYEGAGRPGTVRLLVIHYRREEQGAELINAQNRLFGSDWRWLGGDPERVVAGPDGQRWRMRELRLESPAGRKRVVWSWYDIGGRRLVDDTRAKLWAAANRLLGGPQDASLVALAAGYRFRAQEARQRLRGFLAAHPGLAKPRGVVRPVEGRTP